MTSPLEDLPQYHFGRREFCAAFEDTFTPSDIETIEGMCMETRHTANFLLTKHDDEYYIIHRNSGTIINWYKHLGRTNTCNKENFTLSDLHSFLSLLREDILP